MSTNVKLKRSRLRSRKGLSSSLGVDVRRWTIAMRCSVCITTHHAHRSPRCPTTVSVSMGCTTLFLVRLDPLKMSYQQPRRSYLTIATHKSCKIACLHYCTDTNPDMKNTPSHSIATLASSTHLPAVTRNDIRTYMHLNPHNNKTRPPDRQPFLLVTIFSHLTKKFHLVS